jgi:ketosteroid isomerase-like protein
MAQHPNANLVEKSWQAVAASDVETLLETWSPEIVWHVTGNNPWRGDHVGSGAILEYLAQVGESGESYDATLTDVMASDNRAALVFDVKTKRSGVTLETSYLLLARISEGRIAEVWTLALDPAGVDEFWKRAG